MGKLFQFEVWGAMHVIPDLFASEDNPHISVP
jgi:hypothetical protein